MHQIADIAASQHGVITRKQLVHAGIPNGTIDRMVNRRQLDRLFTSIYKIGGSVNTRHQLFMGAVLSAGEGAMLSHTSAAECFQLNVHVDDQIHIVTPKRRYLEKITTHTYIMFNPSEVDVIMNIPTTSCARTIFDLAELVSPRKLGYIIDNAIQRKLTTLTQIRSCYEWNRTAGRKRTFPLAIALSERDNYQFESILERDVAQTIKRLGLPKPIAQYEISYKGQIFRIDFAYPKQKIAIEVDGYAFHSNRESFTRDRRRDNYLRQLGWTVVRFTSHTSDAEIHDTLTTIL